MSDIDSTELIQRIELACRWLVDTAQVKREEDVQSIRTTHIHRSWKGAIRGEYSAARREWSFFCPIWHTGQAIKALLLAHSILKDESLLHAAKLGVDFILTNQITDKNDPDFGLILAYEDYKDKVNASAILECLEGVMDYAAAYDESLWERIIDAVNWIEKKAYLPGEGLFLDLYDPETRKFIPKPYKGNRARPLFDDAIFLKAYRKTGNERFRQVFLETAECLLQTENPSGNWIAFGPCDREKGYMHPRQAYWWSRPMLDAYDETGDKRYLDCALRSAEWYKNAQRSDGGLFRQTFIDFRTSSFGHAASGIACAAILWQSLPASSRGPYEAPTALALNHCCDVQFVNPSDSNLMGAVLEKALPPDGTDASPYHIRDLGTIFFIQAASRYALDRSN